MLPFIVMCICFFSFGYAVYDLIKDKEEEWIENDKKKNEGE